MPEKTFASLSDAARVEALRRSGLRESGITEPFDRICALACRVLEAPMALVSIIEPDRQFLPGAVGVPPDVAVARETPLSSSICQYALTSDQPLLIEDTTVDARLVGNLAITDLSARAYLGVPLVDEEGIVLGCLCVMDEVPRRWRDHETETLVALSASVMAEISIARMVQRRDSLDAALERLSFVEGLRRSEAEAMLALTRALATSSGLESVAAAVAQFAGPAVGADFSNLAMIGEDGSLKVWHGAELTDDIARRWRKIALDRTTPLGVAALDRERVLIAHPDEIAARFPAGAADSSEAGFMALGAIPLFRQGGALGFAWCTEQSFEGSARHSLDTVAELCDQALGRAATSDRNRQVARVLQRVLLPTRLPAIPDVEVAARYEAAVRDIEVGGDWYDCRALPDERFVLAIGDVVGQGLDAAATMGQLRHAFAGLASSSADLASLVAGIDLVASELDGALLTTAALAVYDPRTRSLQVVSAGHVPVMIRRADGSVDAVPTGDLPLGLVPDEPRTIHELDLASGDVVVFYTDGLVERRGVPIDDCLDELRDDLKGLEPEFSAWSMCDRLLGCRAADGDDDVAVMVLALR